MTLTQQPINQDAQPEGGEYIGTLNPKGGVTIPLAVRRQLKVKPKDKVIFRVQGGKVELETLSMSLEETFGAVRPRHRPENFSARIRAAKEARAEKGMIKLNA